MASVPKVQPQDLFNELARYSADQQVSVVLGLDGMLDSGRLARAVSLLLADEPVLSCRVERDSRRVRFAATTRAALSTVSADDAWSAALDHASQPVDPYTGPLLEVVHVRGLTGDALAVKVDHAAADGQGAKRVAAALAARYAGDGAGGPGSSRDRGAWRLLGRFTPWTLVSEVARRQAPMATWGLPGTGGEPGRRRHEVRYLGASDLESARRWARERGATVNDLVFCAWYRSLFATLSPKVGAPQAVNLSFDMRRYLDPVRPIPAAMNLSCIETALLSRSEGESFEGTLDRIQRETARLKQGRPGLGAAVLLEVVGRLLSLKRLEAMVVAPMVRGRAAGRSYPFLSNFGVIDEAALAFGDVRPDHCVLLGPAAHPPFMMLTAGTYRGRMALALGYCEGEMNGGLVARLADTVLAELVGAPRP